MPARSSIFNQLRAAQLIRVFDGPELWDDWWRRYRGGEGMLAFAFHRISGVAIWLFIVLHVIDIYLVGGDPKAYNTILQVYASTPGRLMEILLGAALLYHALNGMRILIIDLWPAMTSYHRVLWYGSWIVFIVVGLPGAYIILEPVLRPATGL